MILSSTIRCVLISGRSEFMLCRAPVLAAQVPANGLDPRAHIVFPGEVPQHDPRALSATQLRDRHVRIDATSALRASRRSPQLNEFVFMALAN